MVSMSLKPKMLISIPGSLSFDLAPNACQAVDATVTNICEFVRQYGSATQCAVPTIFSPAAATTAAGSTTTG
jgi:hypothetical protein